MFRAFGLSLAMLLLSFDPLFAQQSAPPSRLDAIIAAGVLKVGSTGDYKPFTFKDPATGTFAGFDIDLAQSLASALGVKVEMVPTAWPNLMKDFEARRLRYRDGRRFGDLRPPEEGPVLDPLYA